MADVTVKYKGNVIAEMSEESTKTLNTSGKYCEGNIEVSYIPPEGGGGEVETVNCKIYNITLAKKAGWVELVTLDADVLAHINDPLFTAVLAISDGYTNVNYSGSCFMASNTPFANSNGTSGYPIYGYSHRQSGSSNSVNAIFYPPNNTGTSTSLGGLGAFRVNGSKYYLQPSDGYVRAGNYRLIFTW